MKKKSLNPPPSQMELHWALVKELEAQKRTPAEILVTFQGAGILNKKGDFTRPYRHLARVVKKTSDVS